MIVFWVQELQSGSGHERKDHRSSRKSRDVSILVENSSVSGTSKRRRDRNAKHKHCANGKTTRQAGKLRSSGHMQPAGSVVTALPLELSRRAAYMRQVLVEDGAPTAPSSKFTAQTSHAKCQVPRLPDQAPDHGDNPGGTLSHPPSWKRLQGRQELPRTCNLQSGGAEWKGPQLQHPAHTQAGQSGCQAVTRHTSGTANLASTLPFSAQTSSCHQAINNQKGVDVASSNVQPSESAEALGHTAFKNSSEQPETCRTTDAISCQHPSPGACTSQALLLSTVEAVDEAHSTMLAVNDLHHQIMKGSVQGAPLQTRCQVCHRFRLLESSQSP